jgi:hypothetical protein
MIGVTPEPGPEDMRVRGFALPLQLCHDVSYGMKALGLPFSQERDGSGQTRRSRPGGRAVMLLKGVRECPDPTKRDRASE